MVRGMNPVIVPGMRVTFAMRCLGVEIAAAEHRNRMINPRCGCR